MTTAKGFTYTQLNQLPDTIYLPDAVKAFYDKMIMKSQNPPIDFVKTRQDALASNNRSFISTVDSYMREFKDVGTDLKKIGPVVIESFKKTSPLSHIKQGEASRLRPKLNTLKAQYNKRNESKPSNFRRGPKALHVQSEAVPIDAEFGNKAPGVEPKLPDARFQTPTNPSDITNIQQSISLAAPELSKSLINFDFADMIRNEVAKANSEIQNEVGHLRNEVQHLRKEVKSLRADKKQLNIEVEALVDEVVRLRAENEEQSKELDTHWELFDELVEEVLSSQEQISNLELINQTLASLSTLQL